MTYEEMRTICDSIKPLPTDLSCADHAELWARDKVVIPERGTPEWDAMYQAWIEFAFADFKEVNYGKSKVSRQ